MAPAPLAIRINLDTNQQGIFSHASWNHTIHNSLQLHFNCTSKLQVSMSRIILEVNEVYVRLVSGHKFCGNDGCRITQREKKMSTCAGCKNTSKECQKADWPRHKQRCNVNRKKNEDLRNCISVRDTLINLHQHGPGSPLYIEPRFLEMPMENLSKLTTEWQKAHHDTLRQAAVHALVLGSSPTLWHDHMLGIILEPTFTRDDLISMTKNKKKSKDQIMAAYKVAEPMVFHHTAFDLPYKESYAVAKNRIMNLIEDSRQAGDRIALFLYFFVVDTRQTSSLPLTIQGSTEIWALKKAFGSDPDWKQTLITEVNKCILRAQTCFSVGISADVLPLSVDAGALCPI